MKSLKETLAPTKNTINNLSDNLMDVLFSYAEELQDFDPSEDDIEQSTYDKFVEDLFDNITNNCEDTGFCNAIMNWVKKNKLK